MLRDSRNRLQIVNGAANRATTAVQHVSVYHRGIQVLVAEEFLYTPDVISCFQQMRGKRMSQRMTSDVFVYPRFHSGITKGSQNRPLALMVTPPLARSGIC